MQAAFVHDEPCQEQHDKAFAAAGGAKVGAAFAVAQGLLMGEHIGQQLPRRKILRIAGHHLDLFPVVGVREIDEVVDDVIQPFLAEHALNHSVQGINAVSGAVV